MDSKKILIIDDNLSTLETLADYLEDKGYDVQTANNGIIGLNIIKNDLPDVIISDVRMDGLSGIELTFVLKGLRYNVPVILMSSFETDDEELLNKCSYGFLQKPIDIKKFDKLLSNALSGFCVDNNCRAVH